MAAVSTGAFAQIVADGTVGGGPSTALAKLNNRIEVPAAIGALRGHNLFHSFQTFNLARGETADFTAAGISGIDLVFSRVTGGGVSTIDGTLKSSIPNASFYFMNPAGVVFGPNAKVNVPGAFMVTTADYLAFTDGTRFTAQPSANEMLTVASPAAFGFLGASTDPDVGKVQFNGSSLQFQVRQDVTAAGRGIEIKQDAGTQRAATIRAPGGALKLAAVNSAGELPIADLRVADFSQLGDIEVSGGARLSTGDSAGAGHFLVRGNNLSLTDKSSLSNGSVSDTPGSGRSPESEIELRGKLSLGSGSSVILDTSGRAEGGGLRVAAEHIEMNDGAIIAAARGQARGSDVTIIAGDLFIGDKAAIEGWAYDLARAGNVLITAQNGITLQGSDPGTAARISAASSSNLAGDAGGHLEIHAATLDLVNSSYVTADTSAGGAAGSVKIHVNDLTLSGGSHGNPKISVASTSSGQGGDAGAIDITAQTVRIARGAITANTEGAGKGGSIQILADTLTLDGAGTQPNELGTFIGVTSLSKAGGGNAGAIQIRGESLILRNSAHIRADTHSTGNGGTIDIAVSGLIRLDQLSSIRASPEATSSGRGGDIKIAAGELELHDVSVIGADSSSVATTRGLAGKVTVTVTGKLAADSFSFIGANTYAVGVAGAIEVTAADIELRNFASITSSARGAGRGGDIVVTADRLLLDQSTIQAGSYESASGPVGNIHINAGEVKVVNGAVIDSQSRGRGDAGTISIGADSLSLGKGGAIETKALGSANAGEIRLSVRSPLVLEHGTISSSSGPGRAGSVSISSTTDLAANASTISVKSAKGDAGTLSLLAPGTVLLRNSTISAEAYHDGGNIFVDPQIVGLVNSTLLANAETGHGGHIEVNSGFTYMLSSSVSAKTQNPAEAQGVVVIRFGADFVNSLGLLPANLVEAASQIREGCARKNPRANSLIVRGRGGLSLMPDSFLPGFDLR